MSQYFDQKPVDCTIQLDVSGLKGKTAIVTGGKVHRKLDFMFAAHLETGASGIGESYTRALAGAGSV